MIKGGWQFVNSARSAGSSTGGDPWAPLDGRLAAPTGVPQFPTILNGYPTASPPNARVRWTPSNPNGVYQAPWMVPGVDYRVGSRIAVASMADPTTLTGVPGISVTGSPSWLVEVTGNNVTIQGIDFSLDGGWFLSIDGNNCTVQDCNFAYGANFSAQGGAPNLAVDPGFTGAVFQYNNIDGGCETTSGVGYVNHIKCPVALDSSVIFQYNWVHDCYGQCIDYGQGNFALGNEHFIYRYNLIGNAGIGASAGAHGDWMQCASPPINQNGCTGTAGTNIINVPSIATGLEVGMVVFDGTNPLATGTNLTVQIIGTTTLTLSGNLTQNIVTGDVLQFFMNIGMIEVYFNCFYQTQLSPLAGTLGLTGNGLSSWIASEDVHHNVVLAVSGSDVQQFVDAAKQTIFNFINCSNNYVDPTSFTSGLTQFDFPGSGPWNCPITDQGNISMVDGSSLT